jgi:hypothetical protein
LIDLVRLPNPNRTNRSNVAHIKGELDAADALLGDLQEQDLWVVVPPLIPREYREHAPKAAEKVSKEWKKIDDKVHVSLAATDVVNVSASLPSQTNFCQTLKPLLAEVKQVADKFIRLGLWLKLHDSCRERADHRAINKIAPGHHGGELKDCVIVEHVLSLSEWLDEQGVSTPKVFLTSNTSDFSVEKGSSEPEPPLDSQFDDLGIQMAIRWQEAQAML